MAAPRTQRNQGTYATSTYSVGKASWIVGGPTWAPALRVALATVVLAASGLGCAAESGSEPVDVRVAPATAKPSIFGGEIDDDTAEASGVVALRVGTGSTFELCSGALIAPNVVLTARHCVTRNTTTAVACDEKGKSANGAHVTADEDPSVIGVYLGASPSFAKAPVARARAIVAPSGPYLCDSDIALVVLESSIPNATLLPVRMHHPARAGETIRSVGYGQNDQSSPIGTRFRKGGVKVLAQGAAVTASKTPLGAHEFEVGTSICQGDSGGPAVSEETGAVIGVVSRGGGCADDFGHIYTTTAGFDDVFAEAFRVAGATPTLEDGDGATIAPSTRSSSTATPGAVDDPTSAKAAGCSVATPSSAPTSGALFPAIAAILALGIRRRRSR